VAPAFSTSAEFAIDKPAGHACPHLDADFRCHIHDQLRPRGFGGCAAFDCLGAGQHVTQLTFAGRNWATDPGVAAQMFDAFSVMRQLHEMLWYLEEAIDRTDALDDDRAGLDPLVGGELRRMRDSTESAAAREPSGLLSLDLAALRRETGGLLRRASTLVRAGVTADPGRSRRNRAGTDLRGVSMKGADLRGVSMIGADLRGADLRLADLLGTDLRGAHLGGADFTGSLFLLQSQVDGARGDAATRLPAARKRPAHWTT
jgi:hypothetical protein